MKTYAVDTRIAAPAVSGNLAARLMGVLQPPEGGSKAMIGQYTSVCTLCGKPATDGLCYREGGYVYHADCWIKYQQELRKTRTGS